MPDMPIETRAGWERGDEFLDSIHRTLVEALRIPADDKVQRPVEHPVECCAIPHGTDTFTPIEITIFAGQGLTAMPRARLT